MYCAAITWLSIITYTSRLKVLSLSGAYRSRKVDRTLPRKCSPLTRSPHAANRCPYPVGNSSKAELHVHIKLTWVSPITQHGRLNTCSFNFKEQNDKKKTWSKIFHVSQDTCIFISYVWREWRRDKQPRNMSMRESRYVRVSQ